MAVEVKTKEVLVASAPATLLLLVQMEDIPQPSGSLFVPIVDLHLRLMFLTSLTRALDNCFTF